MPSFGTARNAARPKTLAYVGKESGIRTTASTVTSAVMAMAATSGNFDNPLSNDVTA